MERQQGNAENTIKARRSGLTRYHEWLLDHELEPTAVTPQHIDQYFSEMQGEGYAPVDDQIPLGHRPRVLYVPLAER